jgi:hypothetical protein
MIGFIGTSITITINYNSSNQWLLKTRTIPYWITSGFSFTVTYLVLINESVTFSASVFRWLTLHRWEHSIQLLNCLLNSLNNWTTELPDEWILESESASYITTSDSLSWNKAPIWGLRPDIYYCRTVAGLLTWGVLFDERTGLSFRTAAGPRQRSHSLVRAALDSWQYFTVSDSILPFPSPPTTRRATVEVFDPASTLENQSQSR